ncbi:MAG: hypothetical protein R3A13_03875 [Bdellovibrionota bacterium]
MQPVLIKERSKHVKTLVQLTPDSRFLVNGQEVDPFCIDPKLQEPAEVLSLSELESLVMFCFEHNLLGKGQDGIQRNPNNIRAQIASLLKQNPDGIETTIDHDTFLSNPTMIGDYKADPFSATDSYLNTLNDEYLFQITTLAQQIPELSPDTEITVCIPAAAHEEGRYIYGSLQSLSKQSLENKKFEVVVFANHPEKDKNGNTTSADQTIDEVKRFQIDHPEMQVHLMYGCISPECMTIGLIRSVLFDSVLFRYWRRLDNQDHFLVRFDADTIGVNTSMLETYQRLMKEKPEVDAFCGPINVPPSLAIIDPLAYLSGEFFHLAIKHVRKLTGRLLGYGPNQIVRIEAYAKAAGYSPEMTLGEDINFDTKLHIQRSNAQRHRAMVYAGASTRVYTSPRRGQHAVSFDLPYGQQWSNDHFKFDLHNPEIRTADHSKNRSLEEQLEDPRFKAKLERLLNQTLKQIQGFKEIEQRIEDDLKEGTNRTLNSIAQSINTILDFHFGIEHKLNIKALNRFLLPNANKDPNHPPIIKIKSISKLKARLFRLAKKASEIFESKTSTELPKNI